MTGLIYILKESFDLNDNDWQLAANLFNEEKISKGDYYLRENQICRKISFIKVGLFRLYNNFNGIEKNIHFFSEGEFVSDYFSFLLQTPSVRPIQALEDSILLSINKEKLFELYTKSEKWERVGRILAETAFLTAVVTTDRLLQANYEERVKIFITETPKLVQRVPQFMLASYLNMTPETLCRVKKRIYRKTS
jgi:CRP/FNR family transcriptional regulator, anaerobic regulatory protein